MTKQMLFSYCPAVEVCRLVIVVEYLREYLGVVGVAERVVYDAEVGMRRVVPTALIELGDASAALAEAGIAHLALIAEYDASRGAYGLIHLWGHLTAHTLVALAMVIGADIEMGVSFAVVPTNGLPLAPPKEG